MMQQRPRPKLQSKQKTPDSVIELMPVAAAAGYDYRPLPHTDTDDKEAHDTSCVDAENSSLAIPPTPYPNVSPSAPSVSSTPAQTALLVPALLEHTLFKPEHLATTPAAATSSATSIVQEIIPSHIKPKEISNGQGRLNKPSQFMHLVFDSEEVAQGCANHLAQKFGIHAPKINVVCGGEGNHTSHKPDTIFFRIHNSDWPKMQRYVEGNADQLYPSPPFDPRH